ncbi:toll-like receptor 13 [Biomphalaria pfeifferi]|uniref:Toll-like receptor 13 n=1 Tax=Biomphalaria pfeifferi TaxID=112525 RepID=A0AAD8EVX3_BIOPF|nr:toll-like receptor 13 [Biomphalaria pfeifferi]
MNLLTLICVLLQSFVHTQAQDEMTSLQENSRQCNLSRTTYNCCHLLLPTIPDGIPTNVTILDLSYNLIKETNPVLCQLNMLQELYLGHNKMTTLYNDSFICLKNVRVLDLQGNSLLMDAKTFPKGVFKPLTFLQVLKLNKNNRNTSNPSLFYPDGELSHLVHLSSLHIDGLANKSFGAGFGRMKDMRYLSITGYPKGYCTMESITNETFKYLSQLHVLEIKLCLITSSLVDKLAFQPLSNLQVLDISESEFFFLNHLGPALAAMRSKNFTRLSIHNILNSYFPCARISNDFARSLPRSLTHIIASYNGFALIESDVFHLLPPNLTFLDLSNNRFTFGSYLQNFSALLNLETLILNGPRQSFDLPTRYLPDVEHLCETSLRSSHSTNDTLILRLPPRLKKISLDSTGISYRLTQFHIDPNNSLETLILNGNKIQALIGPMTGLTKLKHLSLADCYIHSIKKDFFDNFTSLLYLNLSVNDFGCDVLKNGSDPIFTNLKNLQELDISFVNILTLDTNAFQGLDNLERLHMERNFLHHFTADISNMTRLQFVNFSMSEISSLSSWIRSSFDSVARKYKLSLDLSENPIHCYCENLEFLTWFYTAQDYIQFLNLQKYRCSFENNSEEYIKDFEKLYRKLNLQCTPKVVLFIIVTSGTVLAMILIFIAIIYKFRWKMKYLYYSAYLYIKTNKLDKSRRQEFLYDVFLSFAHDDEKFIHETLVPELTSRGLKVHDHTVDFIAGELITSNIVSAVQRSRRTLIVVSSNLRKSNWCRFELQMANLESVNTGRPVMVFLLMQHLPEDVLSREMLYHIQNNTYIQLPDEVDNARVMGIFWTKLCSDLLN